MSGYCHLTFEERERIGLLRAEGLCVTEIAALLGRHRSTIDRELSRNANMDGTYRPLSAERRYLARRQRERLLDTHTALAAFVLDRLYDGWTPEQISGWIAAGYEDLPYISHETIYDWLFAKPQRKQGLHKLLPHGRAHRGRRRRYKPRNVIAERRSIHERSQEVEDRTVAGHWEGDLMICKRTQPVLVLKERKSRFVIAAKLAGKSAAGTAKAIMEAFRQLVPRIRKSITFDNDTTFARHTLLRDALNMATWFCDAYASWQKGAVENMNGRLRRDLPRKRDLDKVSDDELQDIILSHNLTPRKCLGFKTPAQALLQELGELRSYLPDS